MSKERGDMSIKKVKPGSPRNQAKPLKLQTLLSFSRRVSASFKSSFTLQVDPIVLIDIETSGCFSRLNFGPDLLKR